MEEPINKKRKKKDEVKAESGGDCQPSSLDLFPEILEKIFGYLDCIDLRNCCLVNRRWCEEARKKITKCIIQLSDFDNLDRSNIWDYTETSIFKEQIKITNHKNTSSSSFPYYYDDDERKSTRFKIHHLTLDDLRIKLNQSTVKHSYQIWLRTDIKTICELQPEIRDAIFYESSHLITHLSLSSSPLHNHRTRYSIPVNKFLTLLHQFLPQLESLTFENSSLLSLDSPSKRVGTTVNNTEVDGELEKSQQQQQSLLLLLVNLKTICFKTPFQFHEMSSTPIYHILKNSPNLQNIRGFPFQFLKKLHGTKKTHALKSLRFVNHNYCSTYSLAHLNVKSNNEFENVVVLGNDTNLKALKKLSQSAVSFEELKVFICFKDTPQKLKKNAQLYKNIFSTLLTGSAETLTRLDMQPMEFISYFNFPLPLKNVKTLGLHGDNPAPGLKAKPDRKFFPNDFNLNVIFPNLTSIDLSIHIRDAAENPLSIFQDFFPLQDSSSSSHFNNEYNNSIENNGDESISNNSKNKSHSSFKCIKNLKILRYMPISCMEKLSGLFSNISTLTLELTTFTDLRKIIRMIFELSTRHCWSRLQRLFIDLKRVRGISVSKNYWNLDEEMTGITNEKCEALRENLQHLPVQAEEKNHVLEVDGNANGNNDDDDIEMYRLYPSILNMKDLRLLQFILPMFIEQDDEPILIFSQVSSIYGFAMLPLLQVHIGFRDYFRYKSPQRLKPLVQSYLGQLYLNDEDDE